MMSRIRKVVAFTRLYGVRRTLFKVAGRARLPLGLVRSARVPADLALIGCGQFGFATIGYFISRRFGARFRWCYDPDPAHLESFGRFYRVPHVAAQPQGWNEDPEVETVYIASNHASHAEYAIESLRAGKTVYVEKPIAVTFEQLERLEAARRRSGGSIYAGYNRPFSPAVRELRRELGPQPQGGITLTCFVSGHSIAPDHWYRDPEEGTRICGNAGHWIDLFMHVCGWRSTPPGRLRLSLAPASDRNPDDNFTLTVTTDLDDVFSLTLTSRSEPFEGIKESIHLQQGEVIASIDDFRSMTSWKGSRCRRRRYARKDAGHEGAILQPFDSTPSRDWDEILRSSIVTLSFAEMVRTGERAREVDLDAQMHALRDRALARSA